MFLKSRTELAGFLKVIGYDVISFHCCWNKIDQDWKRGILHASLDIDCKAWMTTSKSSKRTSLKKVREYVINKHYPILILIHMKAKVFLHEYHDSHAVCKIAQSNLPKYISEAPISDILSFLSFRSSILDLSLPMHWLSYFFQELIHFYMKAFSTISGILDSLL